MATIFTQPTKSIAGLIIDAFITENHSFPAVVTTYPVEEGSDISDHVQLEPTVISIEAVVGGAGILNSFFMTPLAIAAHDALLRVRNSKALITLVTGLKVYPNMIMTMYNPIRNKDNGGSLEFSAVFQEVNTISSETVTIPLTDLAGTEADQLQAVSETDLGKVSSGQTQGLDFFSQAQEYVDNAFTTAGF